MNNHCSRSAFGLARTPKIAVAMVATIAVLMVSACGTSISTAHGEVCNINAAWASAEWPMDRADQAQRRLDDALLNAEDGSVAVQALPLLNAIENSDPDAIRDASSQLRSTCETEGWEPVEG